MIRRDQPLGAGPPARWLLIEQPEHARLSYELARAWGGANVAPLVCPPDETDAELLAVRLELLEAVRRHDDGWLGYADEPLIDDEGRPRNFTEMPAEAAQAMWADSIDVCRSVGPLASWVVASHFHALQAEHDSDFPRWEKWLSAVELRREAWLAEWRTASPRFTEALSDRCLAGLQAFDWMSLWLCCLCPATPGDAAPAGPLVVGSEEVGWPLVEFTPEGDSGLVRVDPWPFATTNLRLEVEARSLAIGDDYSADGCIRKKLAWRLEPC